MKRFKQIWRSFIEQHIAQKDPYAQADSIRGAYSSTEHHSGHNETDLRFLIEHDILSEQAIKGLREGGWDVQLEKDDSGRLFYAVYDNASFNRRVCFLSSYHE